MYSEKYTIINFNISFTFKKIRYHSNSFFNSLSTSLGKFKGSKTCSNTSPSYTISNELSGHGRPCSSTLQTMSSIPTFLAFCISISKKSMPYVAYPILFNSLATEPILRPIFNKISGGSGSIENITISSISNGFSATIKYLRFSLYIFFVNFLA